MHRLLLVPLAVLALSCFSVATAQAYFVSEPERVLAGSSTFGGFGTSVAIDATGTRVVASTINTSSVDRGGVVIFVRTGITWTEEHRLTPPGMTGLGTAVAMDAAGTVVLVGEPGADDGIGAIRVLRRVGTTWTEDAAITSVSGLGRAIALSADGRTALLGAPFTELAYVFQESGGVWSVAATLTAPGAPSGSSFGAAVAISADGAVGMVGAYGEPLGGTTNVGSVRVFRASTGWSLQETLRGLTPTGAGRGFGTGIAIDATGTNAVIASLVSPTRALTFAGTWLERGTIAGSVAASSAVAISGDGSRALVSSPGIGTIHEYLWSGSAWTTVGTVVAESVHPSGSTFGRALAMTPDATRMVVGEPGNSIHGDQAVIYASVGGSCIADAECVSGRCVDGVCCSSACGGGASDCMACAASSTGGRDGLCGPLTAALAPSIVCRAAAGVCDLAETCAATSTVCPTNRFSTSACRASAGPCDPMEFCSLAPDCPVDSLSLAGVACRLPFGACDVAEVCDGVSLTCPADVRVAPGTECRASTDTCDPSESCDGTALCPADTNACVLDAGMPDAGMPDAGIPDAGEPDPGEADAGESDAGEPDVGAVELDAGAGDAGTDAGTDAAMGDAGPTPRDAGPDGAADAGDAIISEACSCRAGRRASLPWWAIGLVLLAAVQRMRRWGVPRSTDGL